MDLADSLGLVRSLPELPVPTHYSDTDGHANLVIDLIFLGMSCAQVLHCIEPDLRRPSDHAPLLVDLPISPENIRFSRKVLKRDSDEKNDFLSFVTMGLRALNSNPELDLSVIGAPTLKPKTYWRYLGFYFD